jgi:2-polyprenyl-3-methyl-5-hydroxy-6-metoxy-1,4-benzoquinol methylase
LKKLEACPISGSRDLVTTNYKLRDSDAHRVIFCPTSRHTFLDTFDHLDNEYFVNDRFLLSKPFAQGINQRLRHFEAENEERLERIGPMLVNKRVLEFGCGAGALMHKIAPLVDELEGVERTASFKDRLREDGFKIHNDISETEGSFDAILMFHVLEHLTDPVGTLAQCFKRLRPGGFLYVEVPNINDALLTLYEVEDYKRFHFFLDHLHYFSRFSLGLAFERAKIDQVRIAGHNRFGLANHLYWLKAGKPGGHNVWNFLETPSTNREYARSLAALDMSDSLVAQAWKPK